MNPSYCIIRFNDDMYVTWDDFSNVIMWLSRWIHRMELTTKFEVIQFVRGDF